MRGQNYTAGLKLATGLLALLFIAQPVRALEAPDSVSLLQIGQRIRVDYDTTVTKHLLYVIPWSSREKRKTTGSLVSWSSDTIVIASDQLDDRLRAFPEWSVRKLYISNGRRRATAEGIGYGAVIGFFPVFLRIFEHIPGTAEYDDVRRNRFRSPLIVWGGITLVGGIIGWFTKVDRWRELKKSDWPFQLELSNQIGDFGLNLTYSF